MDVIRAK